MSSATLNEDAIIDLFVKQPGWVPLKVTKEKILAELRRHEIKTASQFIQALPVKKIFTPFICSRLANYLLSNPLLDVEEPTDDELAVVKSFNAALGHEHRTNAVVKYMRRQEPPVGTVDDLADAAAQGRLKPEFNGPLVTYFESIPPPRPLTAVAREAERAELKDLVEQAGVIETSQLNFAKFGIESVAQLRPILLDESKRPLLFPGAWIGKLARTMGISPSSSSSFRVIGFRSLWS